MTRDIYDSRDEWDPADLDFWTLPADKGEGWAKFIAAAAVFVIWLIVILLYVLLLTP